MLTYGLTNARTDGNLDSYIASCYNKNALIQWLPAHSTDLLRTVDLYGGIIFEFKVSARPLPGNANLARGRESLVFVDKPKSDKKMCL